MVYVDESTLDPVERLGLAYCRLIHWEWDDMLGPKPDGFDSMPCGCKPIEKVIFRRRTRDDYVTPAIGAIKKIIGEANCSRFHWRFNLGRSDEDWIRWYLVKDLPDYFTKRMEPIPQPIKNSPEGF